MPHFFGSLVIVMAMALTSCAASLSSEAGPVSTITGDLSERGWSLVWADEFEGETLDRRKWAPEVSCWGGGNEERQCYVDRPETVRIADGFLHLTAIKGTVSGPGVHMEHPDYPGEVRTQPYMSGKVRTRDLASWTYGRIEGRIKLPNGQGAWPAFWMMPQESVYGGWPLSGEIDIMEAVNLGAACDDCGDGEVENRSSGAIHFGKRHPDNVHVDRRRALTNQADQVGPAREQFHTYAVEWGEGRIDWFVDGNRFYSVTEGDWFTDAVSKADNADAPFDRAFYVMLNFAVGGCWPEGANEGGVDPDAFPNQMVIDYVRVYQCVDDPETGRACMISD